MSNLDESLPMLVTVAHKDLRRICVNLKGEIEPDVIYPTGERLLSFDIPVRRGYIPFKNAYIKMESQLLDWRTQNPDVKIYLRWITRPDEWNDIITLQVFKYANQETVLQDKGLHERQTQPGQVQLLGGESDSGVRTVRNRCPSCGHEV